MNQTVLLTLGRLPKGLDVARSFAAHGYRVVVADPFRWHLCRVSRDVARSMRVPPPATDKPGFLHAIADAAMEEGAALIVPVGEETLTVAALAGSGVTPPVYAMPVEALSALHDKLAFIETARSFGLDAPETYRANDARARELAARSDVVIKPIHSCSGRGLRIHERGDPAALKAPNAPSVMQALVPGDVLSSFSLTHKGRVLVTVVYRALVLSGTVAVAFERVQDHSAILAWVETFTHNAGLSGFMSFDFIEDEDGRPWAIECNPRLTSGVHFLDQRDLAPAILSPDTAGDIRFRPELRVQQFFPVLTEAQSPFFWRPAFKQNAKYLFTVHEVSWSARDPAPLLLQPLAACEILQRTLFRGMTFGEAATVDIEWRADA